MQHIRDEKGFPFIKILSFSFKNFSILRQSENWIGVVTQHKNEQTMNYGVMEL